MKIIFEKYDIESDKILENWTKLFDNIDELLKFLIENKNYLLGGYTGKYKIIIKDVEMYEKDGL